MFAVGYVCGALCADGGIYLNGRHGHYQIQLETSEKEFADKLGAYIVSLYGKRLVTDFANKWGCRTSTYTWKIPETAFANRRFRAGFLRGFFDGEATVRVRFKRKWPGWQRNIRVTSAHKRGLEQLKELLEKEEIKSIIYPAGRYWCLDIEGKRRLISFQEKIGFGLERKKRKLRDAIR